jgi:hypothetical protein
VFGSKVIAFRAIGGRSGKRTVRVRGDKMPTKRSEQARRYRRLNVDHKEAKPKIHARISEARRAGHRAGKTGERTRYIRKKYVSRTKPKARR